VTQQRHIRTPFGSVDISSLPWDHSQDNSTDQVFLYRVQLENRLGSGFNGEIDRNMLRPLIEACTSILGELPVSSFTPEGPLANDVLIDRAARKVWLQKRLRGYGAAWEKAYDPNAGLRLQYEGLEATVTRYEDTIHYWHLYDTNDDLFDWQPLGPRNIYEGLAIGLAEGMIEASEALVKLLDARAADANKRLGGGE